MASPAFSHRLPSVFKDPDQYQPERFQPPREEEKTQPYSYIGFGGGRHACLGQNFAYLQIKACPTLTCHAPRPRHACWQRRCWRWRCN